MECKSLSDFNDSIVLSELIETLWNVNLNENTKQMTELIELIETLWNVNTGLLVWFYRRNRN